MKKIFNLPEHDIAIIQRVKQEKGYHSEVQALVHILETYQDDREKEKLERDIYAQVNKELREVFSSLVIGNRQIEKNTNALVDYINSYMILKPEKSLKCIPASLTKSEFIKKSEEVHRSRIAERSRKRKYLASKRR
ncbi:hypothetical protein ABXS75_10975 [Roseburia hominis]